MRVATAGWIVLILVALVGSAAATGGGKVLMYGGGGQGKVIFDGRTHASAGLGCADCHTTPPLFRTRKLALITTDDHSGPTACFACHDGRKQVNECESCHRKF